MICFINKSIVVFIVSHKKVGNLLIYGQLSAIFPPKLDKNMN
jgi:hypothetical protein